MPKIIINEEELEKVSGGKYELIQILHDVNDLLNAVITKFEAWYALNPNAAEQERLNKVNEFVEEIILTMDEHHQGSVSYFRREYYERWNQILKSIAHIALFD